MSTLCPFPFRMSPEIHLDMKEIVSIGVSGVIHLIGHIFMMQMDFSISAFDSGSRAHFRSE